MPRSEPLYHLSCCAAILRMRGDRSLGDVQAAAPDQLRGDLGRWHGEIMRLIGEAHPDVLATMFPPEGITWSVYTAGTDMRIRYLTIQRKEGPTLQTTYDFEDADGERGAWEIVRSAVRA